MERDGEGYTTVSLLSDYGYDDETAGLLRAVIADMAPHAKVVDITHGIAPFDVRAGSLALARSIAYLPRGVVIAAVQPEVGTAQRLIAVEVGAAIGGLGDSGTGDPTVATGSGVLIGPDNGLLAPAVAIAGGAGRVVQLDNDEYHIEPPGYTSAGRDVFAPAAAALCNGIDLADLGSLVDAETLMPGVIPIPRLEGDELLAEVLWIDRFGNTQLNLVPEDLEALAPAGHAVAYQVAIGEIERVVKPASSFAVIPTGAVGMVMDASGLLTLALDRRSAADELSAGVGSQVIVRALRDPVPPPAVVTPIGLRRRN
jgi:S-adenosyl-L-methionine hydrolase (adenosine-forming)